MGDFLSAIAAFFEMFFSPKGGKGTALPEEYRPKIEPEKEARS